MPATETQFQSKVVSKYSDQPESFYHRHGAFTCYADKSTRTVQDGVSTVIDPPPIVFRPCGKNGGGEWGVHVTKDPKIKEYFIETRQDVLTAEQYEDAIMTPDQKVVAAHREIARKNRLIEKLQSQVKAS